MKNIINELCFWILPVFLIAIAIPCSFANVLQAELPLPIIFVPALIKIACDYTAKRLQNHSECIQKNTSALSLQLLLARGLNLCSLLLCGVAAFLIIAIINITPYSLFSYWLESPAHLKDAVVISHIFTLLASLFTALQCGAVLSKRSYKPLLVLAILLLGLIMTIAPNLICGSLLALTLVCLILVYIRRNRTFYLGLLSFAALCGLAIFNVFPPLQGSKLVDNFISPQLRSLVNWLLPDYPLALGLPGYGYAFGENRLGGRPTLSTINLFEVEGSPDKTFYLREKIFDLYTGSEWKSAQLPAIPQNFRTVDSPPPAQQVILKLTLIKGPYYFLPHTLGTTEIYYQDQAVTIPYQAAWDSRAFLKNPLPGGAIIYLVALPEQVSGANTPKTRNSPELTPNSVSPGPYLQLPANIPLAVADCARRLGNGLTGSREILISIGNFLSNNNVYDLDAPALGKDEDFVEKFLIKDRRGYCVHFASAFVILARLNNIPARYVTGYLLNAIADPTHTGKRYITGFTSHAWPEVWLPDRGWITWEATHAVNPANYNEGAAGLLRGRNFSLSDYTLRQLSGILGRTLWFGEQPDAKEQSNPLFSGIASRLPYLELITAGCGLLIWLLQNAYSQILARVRPREAISIYLHKLLRKSSRRHKELPEPAQHGWLEWFNALKNCNSASTQELEHLQNSVLKALYSNQPIDYRDLQALKGLKKILRK